MITYRPSLGALRLQVSAAALIAAAVLAGPALADVVVAADTAAVADMSGAKLDEIVVTAEKRSTNMQKTPIAISVVGADDLVNRHAQGLSDLADGAIPSLRIAPFFARSSALTLGMRGIGALGDANQPARDQAVGVYIDGVYLGRAQGLGSALFDVERIEVLKGPQGTLFGRNTEGGAISIVTRKPSGDWRLRSTVGAGNYGQAKGEIHLDLPRFQDLAIKLDGLYAKRNGTVKNPAAFDAPDFNAYDKRGFHIEGLWTPTDAFSADYAFDISRDATTPYYVQLIGPGSLTRAPLIKLQDGRAKTANVGVPFAFSIGDTYGHRLSLSWKPNDKVEIRSISSYRNLDQGQFDNAEENLSAFAPNGAFSRYSLAHVWQDQYSTELQALVSLPYVEMVGGAFYFHEKVSDNAQTPNTLRWNATGTAYTTLAVDLATWPRDRASHVTTQSEGVYAQAVITPPMAGDIFHLTLGGRFTQDSKKGGLDIVNGALPSYVNANKVTITGVVPLDETWHRFDPLVNLAVDVSDDVHVYGRYATGYKAGGANSRSLTYRAFNPETVAMWEVGAKTEFWDKRGRFNIAAYTGELKDAQVDFSVIILNNNRGTLETTNATSLKTRGVELDASLVPVAGLTLNAGYAYTKVDTARAFNPFTNGVSPVYPLYTPKQSWTASADYERPLTFATLNAHADVAVSDGQYTSTTDPTLSDKSTVANARIGLSQMSVNGSAAKWGVSLWSRNLLNEDHAFLKNFNAALGTYAIYNEPRTYGVEVNLNY